MMKQICFAANLKRLRTYYGNTQNDVAKELCVSRQAYSAYERGIRIPDLDTAAKIATFYHTTVDCLMWAEDPVAYWRQAGRGGYGFLNEVGQIFQLDGSGAKMLQRYLGMTDQEKREVEAFVTFKENYVKRAGM